MSSPGKTRLRKRKGTKSRSPAITFGTKSVVCLIIFAIIYGTFMICFQPMLREENAKTLRDSLRHVRKPHRHVKNGFKHAKEQLMEREKHLVDKMMMNSKGRGAKIPQHQTNHDPPKPNQREHLKHHEVKYDTSKLQEAKNLITVDEDKEVGGFMVLGMHRSGTSMLAGLLVEGFGYNPGQPLIQPAYDNEKGFYELIPAVLQNDVFMADQRVDWATNVKNYDAELALKHYNEGKIEFVRGTNALKVLNDPKYRPFLQKDPRYVQVQRGTLLWILSLLTYRLFPLQKECVLP